ncbi:MAG TPA: hypothetical protein VII58_01835 [Acidobacteriaceae bacterium]
MRKWASVPIIAGAFLLGSWAFGQSAPANGAQAGASATVNAAELPSGTSYPSGRLTQMAAQLAQAAGCDRTG